MPEQTVQGMEKSNYYNLKSQCIFKMAKRIGFRQVYIIEPDQAIQDEISEELSYWKRHNFEKDGKLQVMPKELVKEQIGRSPDSSDAIMMREFLEMAPSFLLGVA